MVQQITSLLADHPGAFGVASAWAVREVHVLWPALTAAFPYARANGGIFGIAREFFVGQKCPGKAIVAAPVGPSPVPTETSTTIPSV